MVSKKEDPFGHPMFERCHIDILRLKGEIKCQTPSNKESQMKNDAQERGSIWTSNIIMLSKGVPNTFQHNKRDELNKKA